jgi:hypothetical protein
LKEIRNKHVSLTTQSTVKPQSMQNVILHASHNVRL